MTADDAPNRRKSGAGRRGVPDRVIRASELGQYVFCARAWWLGSVERIPSANVRELEAGAAAHERHGRTLQLSFWLGRAGVVCLVQGMIVLALFILMR